MKGVVIVTAHTRADFLWACLYRLSIADGAGYYRYLIAIDKNHHVDVQNVAYEFRDRSPLDVTITHQLAHPYHGNSFNTLSAYKKALEMTDQIVHLVEDDIFVAKGYLRWHEAVHTEPCFAASACRDQNAPLPPGLSVADQRALSMIYERPHYQSLGVSFRAAVLRDEILPIATSDYFARPVETLAARFPNTLIPRGQAEQDGLINRVAEARWGTGAIGVIYPAVPRAFHAGFHGANRSNGRPLTEGSIEDRGKRLLDMTELEMNDRADPSYRDIHRCELDFPEPTPLVLTKFVF